MAFTGFYLLDKESIIALRLEDMLLSTTETVSRLLEFLSFPSNPLIDDFISKHLSIEIQDRVLAGRNYNTSKLSLAYVQKIQTTCKTIFDSLGYGFVNQSDKYYSIGKVPVLSKSHKEVECHNKTCFVNFYDLSNCDMEINIRFYY